MEDLSSLDSCGSAELWQVVESHGEKLFSLSPLHDLGVEDVTTVFRSLDYEEPQSQHEIRNSDVNTNGEILVENESPRQSGNDFSVIEKDLETIHQNVHSTTTYNEAHASVESVASNPPPNGMIERLLEVITGSRARSSPSMGFYVLDQDKDVDRDEIIDIIDTSTSIDTSCGTTNRIPGASESSALDPREQKLKDLQKELDETSDPKEREKLKNRINTRWNNMEKKKERETRLQYLVECKEKVHEQRLEKANLTVTKTTYEECLSTVTEDCCPAPAEPRSCVEPPSSCGTAQTADRMQRCKRMRARKKDVKDQERKLKELETEMKNTKDPNKRKRLGNQINALSSRIRSKREDDQIDLQIEYYEKQKDSLNWDIKKLREEIAEIRCRYNAEIRALKKRRQAPKRDPGPQESDLGPSQSLDENTLSTVSQPL